MIDLTPVNSSNMHSAGHDGQGQLVRFHVAGCPRTKGAAEACNCKGGPTYRYPGVPLELHAQMLAAPSIASFHHAKIKTAKDPKTLALLYPVTKLPEEKKADA